MQAAGVSSTQDAQQQEQKKFTKISRDSLGGSNEMLQQISTASSSSSSQLLSISFHLKQCTVYNNKFGCYSIDLRYGGVSRRSPTINILKEKINLNVVINLMEVQFEDKDVQISLFNQTLAKSKQTDILLSQQTLPLSQFKEASTESKKDQIMTFSQGGQVKAEIRFVLAVRGMSELDDLKGGKEVKKRNFLELLKEWMRDKFLVRIIAKFRQNEIRLAEEERLRILKEQEDELAKKKQEEQAALKKKRMEEEEKAKAEMKKKQEEILRKRQEKQRELEEKEMKRKQEEDLRKEEEEKQRKKDEQERKRKKREEDQKKAMLLKEKEEREAMERQIEQEELKMYEGDNFEAEVEEVAKHKQKPPSKKKIQDEQEDEEIEEDLREEQEGNDDQKKNGRKGPVSSAVVFKSMARKRNSNLTTSLPEFNGIVMLSQGIRSPDNRSTSLKQFSRKSTSVNNPRSFMSLLKQWMSTSFLKKIIKKTNLEDRLIAGYQSHFFIFGDETFPFIVKFCPKTQEIQKLPLPKSLQIYRYSQAVSLPNGKIFTCGGVNSRLNNILPFAQIYDPYLNAGFPLPSMAQARYTHSAAYFRGYVYVIGGRSYGSGETSILCSFERFSLSSNSWETLQSLSDGRCTTSLIGLPSWKNYLFLIGGFSPRGRLNTIERYNILEDSWKTLNVTLPSEVEAGISIVSAGKSSFYFLYGRGNKDRNEDIFEISISGEESSEKYEISEIGKITKTKVLPAYFVDDNSQKLFVFGGDEAMFSSFALPSFQFAQPDQQIKASSIFPADTKMFSYSQCALEQPKRPLGANTKETFYSHFVLVDAEGAVKQIKTGKEQISSVSQLEILSKSLQNYSCSLLDNNYLVVFGGDYLTSKNLPQNNVMPTRLSKECFVQSLTTGKSIRRSPSLTAKRNSTIFVKNQMIYSFGGEKSTNQGSCEITTLSERFLVLFNKWERISPLPAAVAQSKVFEFGPQIYLLGGISAGRTFNSAVFEYNLQLDYFINSAKQVPIEFKNSFQFYTKTTKQVTPFVLIFSTNFKAQGVFNLIDGSFIKTDILPGYSDDDKRSLIIAQEAEFISFIFSNRIEIFRAFIPDSTLFSQLSIQGIEFLKLKEVPLTPSTSKNPNLKHAFLTRFVSQQMEIYDFLDHNLVTNTGISAKGQSLSSKDKKENPSIVAMFLDNQGEANFVRQDISSGQEDFLDFRTKEKTENQPIKFHKKSILCQEQETGKIFISGGIEDTKSNAVPYIIEVDLNSKKTSIIGEMLTPRHSHCSVIVGDYLYMIGGCANTNGNYKKNSATSQSFQRLQQIAATKNANAQAVIEIQSQLASKKRSNLENARIKMSSGAMKDDKSKHESASQNLQNLLQGEKKYFIPSKNYLGEDDDFEDDQGTFNGNQGNNNNNSSGYINESFSMRMSAGQINVSRSSISIGNQKGNSVAALVVLKKVDRLNLRTYEMESVADLGLGVMNASCCVMRGGSIYVIGGKDSVNTTTDCIQKYETFSNSWEILHLKLSEPLHSMSTYAVGFSQIIVLGGIKATNTFSNDIYVIDSKSGNISKSTGSFKNKHVSGIVLAGRRKLFALDKDSIQMTEPVSNFDSFSISEISPISAIDNNENINLIGAFLMNIHDESSNSISKKSLDNFLLIGNEINKRMIHFDIRNQRLKQIEVPKNLQLISQSSACFAEDTQSVVISGGVDLQNGGIVSSQIQLFKLNSQSIILKQQLILPRFLHASICIGNVLFTIGGKTNQQSNNLPFGLQSPDALLHSQKSLMSQSTSERSPISRASTSSSSSFSCTAECEIFDLKNLKGQSISRLNIPRSNIQIAILLDHIFVFGGFGGDKRLRSIEKYSQKKDSWQIIDCYLPFDLESYQLCQLSPAEALIVGGKENGSISTKMFIFNAKFHVITLLSFSLPAELPAFKCAVFGDELFIFGANKTTPLSVSLNLRNGFEDHSKIQSIPLLSAIDANWSAVLFK